MNPVTIAIPVRSFHDGKTRLAAVLPERERLELVRNMLDVVIQAALDSGVAEKVVLVSADEAVTSIRALARRARDKFEAAGRSAWFSSSGAACPSQRDRGGSSPLAHSLRRSAYGDARGYSRDPKERTPVVIATDWIGGGSNGCLLNLNDPVTHDFLSLRMVRGVDGCTNRRRYASALKQPRS